MMHVFHWLVHHFADDGVYLWVMEDNQIAREFYDRLGASCAEIIDKPNPAGGGVARNCRYTWTSPWHIHQPTGADQLG